MTAERSEKWFFGGLLILVVLAAGLILMPYLTVLVLAGTLAFLFEPIYKAVLRVVRYEALAALLVVILVALIIFVPLWFFGLRIFQEAVDLYTALTAHGGFDFVGAINNFFNAKVITTVNVNAYVQQALTWFIQNFGSFFSSIAKIFFTAFLSLFGLFYFLKDGERMKEWLIANSPLEKHYSKGIITEMEAAASSVVRGTLLVAIIQGIILGVSFYLFNIPEPAFWGALAIPISIIPVVGTWLVVVPGVVYLFLTGQTILGLGLAIWSIVFVNLIYNLLTAQFVRRGVSLHPYIILLSVLGGTVVVGAIGLLVGALVMALLLSLFKIYPKIYRG